MPILSKLTAGSRNNEILELVILLKVFDLRFLDDEECEMLGDFDPNNFDEVVVASERLLIPEFETFSLEAKNKLISLLLMLDEISDKDLDALFSKVDMAFQNELKNKRQFLLAIRNTLTAG